MELIFSLLPLPLMIAVLATVGVGGLLIRKLVKSKNVLAITETVVDSVMTVKLIDQTVEAVLAKLKVSPGLADKLGDLIAEIIVTVTTTRTDVAAKATNVKVLMDSDSSVVPAVALRLVEGPTLLNNLIVDVAAPVVSESITSRAAVATGVMKAYAEHRVL